MLLPWFLGVKAISDEYAVVCRQSATPGDESLLAKIGIAEAPLAKISPHKGTGALPCPSSSLSDP